MKKIMIVIILLIGVLKSQGQEIRLAVWQDARLAVAEDKTGKLKPFTLDVLTKLKLIGHKCECRNGFIVVSPMFEYAEISSIYKRFAFDVGYTFDESIKWGIEVTPSINYGIQNRWGLDWMVLGADLEVSVRVADGLRISALGQLVQRKDLDYAYGGNNIGASGFIGVQYRIFTNMVSK